MKRILSCFILALLISFSHCSVAQINSFPYFEDFELSNGGWTSSSLDTITVWQHGTPNYGLTTGAYSGSLCWDINLNTIYGDNANAELITPSFDFTSLSVPLLSFYINCNKKLRRRNYLKIFR